MRVSAHGLTDIGKERTSNADFFTIRHFFRRDEGILAIAIADGMGDRPHSEAAGRMFCERSVALVGEAEIFSVYDRHQDRKLRNLALRTCLDVALQTGQEIYRRSMAEEALRGMRTSGILMVVVDNSAFFVQLGNIRGYLIRGGTIYRLTEDHTVANDLVKRRGMSRREAAKNPYADAVNRAWGGRIQSEPDTLHVTLEAGDRILLCTDGLHRHLRGKDILARSRAHTSSEAFLAELTNEANRRGGHDNIALVALDVGIEGEASPMEPALDKQFEMMKNVFLFQDLNLQELTRVKRIAHCVRVRAGEAVIREADIGEDFFILLDGEVRVVKGSKVLTTITVGGHFGELALIDGPRRSADVVAETDGVLLAIQREDFLGLLKEDKGLGNKLLMNLLRNLSARVRDLSEHVALSK